MVGAGQCVEAVVEYDMAVTVDNRHSQISDTARQSQNRDAVGELVEDIVVNHLKPLIQFFGLEHLLTPILKQGNGAYKKNRVG